ncbi:putative glutamate--cysteine ligase 2 [Virgisporangium aliadipatigenens]|uniref:Putative glutamate--cysteine ligase 2 n=1 Tax=Virgisporangium aliadipatigenens TaxID=741659 RepID=A0A8J3YQ06_9ACTN|nr:YbdK family carboxylate-amine ligase [Virgisporangium aliadipatigenens]GIJ47895.1 putative glutamate--cysteine ligase 2 [Virgisporangium aliadipatigenens]
MLTLGVEEEFFLLGPDGAVAPVAAEVVRAGGGAIVPEYMAYQVETATGVCTRLDELRADLWRRRAHAATVAARAGAWLVASGSVPFPDGPVSAVADDARYRALARRFPYATLGGGSSACHVHVGIADRALAVDVLGRLRAWLPALLACTVNSPIIAGVDSGWASVRYRRQLRWPTFRPPSPWPDPDGYDRAVRVAVARGTALDPASVYFLARLSARYPTVEIRVADACPSVDDAVLLAGVTRALVASLVEDVRRGVPAPDVPPQRLTRELLVAAQHGVDPRSPDRAYVAVDDAVRRLFDRIDPVLHALGDDEFVHSGLERLGREGTGAVRQRTLWAKDPTPAAFTAALADATLTPPG